LSDEEISTYERILLLLINIVRNGEKGKNSIKVALNYSMKN
jgi:hypothetical protein